MKQERYHQEHIFLQAAYTLTQLVCGDYLDAQLKATPQAREVLWSNAKKDFCSYAPIIDELRSVMLTARQKREKERLVVINFGLVNDVIARRLLSDITLVRAESGSRFLEAREIVNEMNVKDFRTLTAPQVISLILRNKLKLPKK